MSTKKKSGAANPAPTSKTTPAASGDEAERIAKLIVAATENAPEKLKPYTQYVVKAAPYLAMMVVYMKIALPHILRFYAKITELVAMLPMTLLRSVLGFVMCFWGGVFPATIAAVEAFKLCGGDAMYESLRQLKLEAVKLEHANEEDDAKDEDHDGIADVNEISGGELLKRKASLVVRTIDPQVINGQMCNVYTAWVGVIATLKIQFAKTIALGAAIGKKLYEPANKYIVPPLKSFTPEEHQKWVPVITMWVCKSFAIWVAWWVQRILSAFHSAIRGGHLCGEGIVSYLHDKGYLKSDAENTYIDECIGWVLALLGLLAQFYFGFGVPFPFNLILFPVSCFEAFVVWSINS